MGYTDHVSKNEHQGVEHASKNEHGWMIEQNKRWGVYKQELARVDTRASQKEQMQGQCTGPCQQERAPGVERARTSVGWRKVECRRGQGQGWGARTSVRRGRLARASGGIQQRFIFTGKQLEDGHTLSDLGKLRVSVILILTNVNFYLNTVLSLHSGSS